MNKQIEINKVQNHIYRVFPHAKNVEIKVKKLSDGNYKSLIKVHVPRKKTLFAQKIDEEFSKSLEKSHLAIIRQVHKLKSRWDKTRYRKEDYLLAA